MSGKKWTKSAFALLRDDKPSSASEPKSFSHQKLILVFFGFFLLVAGWLSTRTDISQSSNVQNSTSDRLIWTVSAIDDSLGSIGPQMLTDGEILRQLRPVEKLDIYENKVARWFQVRVFNPKNVPLVAIIKKSSYASLQIFEQRSNDPLRKENFVKNFDSDRKLWSDVFTSHYVHFLGDSSAASSVTFWVRATAATRLILPIQILPQDEAAPHVSVTSVAFGAYYGAILVMIFYNAFLFFFISDRVYLIYVFYLSAFLLTQMSVDSFLPSAFHLGGNIWTGHIGIVFGLLTVIFLTFYTRVFLGLAKYAPRLDNLAKGTIWLFSVALLISVAAPYSFGLKVVYLSNIACSLVLMVIGLGSYLGGYKPARYFIIGNLVLIAASLFMALLLLGVIQSPRINVQSVDFFIKLGSALEVVFFSFALADRVNLILVGYAKSQQSLHEATVAKLESEKKMTEERAKTKQFMAIAQMAQTLAHDIRRPFSMMKIGLDRLAMIGDDPREVKEVVKKILVHVGKSFDDVNHMISDIMEVSSGPSNIYQESISLRSITLKAIHQTFVYQESSDIKFEFNMQHKYMCQIDDAKILRVIGNILDNARQAMLGKGLISISTRDIWIEASQRVEVSIRNSDSFINPDDLDSVFEPFFTKGKKGGTGLGLAISRKIIEAHGGYIYCKSKEVQGTEFVFTLPANADLDITEVKWPEDSALIRQNFEKTLSIRQSLLRDEVVQQRTRQGLRCMTQIGRPFRVLVIDDESIYAEGIKDLVKSDSNLQFEFTCVDDPDAAFQVIESSSFDLIICDVDFPNSRVDGFEFVVNLRKKYPDIKICVHSNRIVPTDYRYAVQAGADSYLPKPMTFPHLIGLVVGDRFVDASA